MSMFDYQGIPDNRDDGDGLQFEDALASLIDYSLVRAEIQENSLHIYRLVQLSVRTWLSYGVNTTSGHEFAEP